MRLPTWGPALFLIACTTGKDQPTDTDTGVADTDIVDTDVADTGDTGAADTDTVDTDGEHVVMHGQLFCTLPDTDTPDGAPATPGFAKITLVAPWTCLPLSTCSENTNIEVIAEATLDEDGKFDLDFQTGPYRVDELYLYTNVKDGVCGNGYQFTQWKVDSYADLTDIVIDVDSIFF